MEGKFPPLSDTSDDDVVVTVNFFGQIKVVLKTFLYLPNTEYISMITLDHPYSTVVGILVNTVQNSSFIILLAQAKCQVVDDI